MIRDEVDSSLAFLASWRFSCFMRCVRCLGGLLLACLGACGGSGSAVDEGARDASRALTDAGHAGDVRRDSPHPLHDAARLADARDARQAIPDAHDAPRPIPDAPAGASDAGPMSDAGTDAASDAVDGATCSDGTPIAYTRTSCSGSPPAVPQALASAVSTASPGSIVSLDGIDEGSLPCFPVRVCVPLDAPTLIFSDDPESPSSDGVLYADELAPGSYRAYVYHSNADTSLRSFPAVLLNQGTTTVHAQITAEGVAGPSQDYVDVGKQALLRWFDSQGTTTTVDVPAGERVLLSSSLAALSADTSDLVHGIIDFSVDGPVKVSVVSILATEDATVVTAGLDLLPEDGVHLRGSFPGAALEIESIGAVGGAGGLQHLRMGGGVTDESLAGHDYVDDTSVTLDGNYGVSYTFNLLLGGPLGLLLSPQGGDWGGASTLQGTAGAGPLPASQDALGTQTQAISLGVYGGVGGAPVAGLGFLTAGGSNLPVDLVTAPIPLE